MPKSRRAPEPPPITLEIPARHAQTIRLALRHEAWRLAHAEAMLQDVDKTRNKARTTRAHDEIRALLRAAAPLDEEDPRLLDEDEAHDEAWIMVADCSFDLLELVGAASKAQEAKHLALAEGEGDVDETLRDYEDAMTALAFYREYGPKRPIREEYE